MMKKRTLMLSAVLIASALGPQAPQASAAGRITPIGQVPLPMSPAPGLSASVLGLVLPAPGLAAPVLTVPAMTAPHVVALPSVSAAPQVASGSEVPAPVAEPGPQAPGKRQSLMQRLGQVVASELEASGRIFDNSSGREVRLSPVETAPARETRKALKAARGSMREALDFINAHESFLVLGHSHPDGDALGSTLGMAGLLRKLGKTVYTYNQDQTPPFLQFLPGSKDVIHDPSAIPEVAAVITVDCSEERMVGPKILPFLAGRPVLTVDHHETNTGFGQAHWIVPEKAAAAEMVAQLAKPLGVKPDRDTALALYVGLFTDSNQFKHQATTAQTLRSAARLVAAGVKPDQVAAALKDHPSAEDTRILGAFLSSIEYNQDYSRADAALPAAEYDRVRRIKTAVGATFAQLLSMSSVKVAVVYSKGEANQWIAQLRAKGEVDVSAVAQRFGGGGHRNAAAGRSSLPLKEFQAQVRQAIEEVVHPQQEGR